MLFALHKLLVEVLTSSLLRGGSRLDTRDVFCMCSHSTQYEGRIFNLCFCLSFFSFTLKFLSFLITGNYVALRLKSEGHFGETLEGNKRQKIVVPSCKTFKFITASQAAVCW